MLTQEKQLVIFDLDGTLMDTAPEVMEAVNDVMAEAGLPEVTLEQTHQWLGQGAGHFLERALTASGNLEQVVVDDLLARFYHFYEQRSGTNSRLYPYVPEVLEYFSQQGLKLAVLTNKFKVGADKALKAKGLFEYFDWVLGGDSFEQKKPDPVGVHFLMSHYQLSPEQVLFLGDSRHDVKTAQRAGVQVWVFPHGYNHGEPLEASQPDKILSGFEQLLPKKSAF